MSDAGSDLPEAADENDSIASVVTDIFPVGWEWILVFGGALMVIGSFLPWTHASIGAITLNRNGMQLGNHEGFSVDGLVTLVFGLLATLIGITRLTHTAFPRWIGSSAIADGMIGLAVGLNGLSGASDYTSTVQSGSSLVSAGVGYGIWIVIVGSVMVTITGLLSRFNEDARRQWIYAGVVVAIVIGASIALYPKASSTTPASSSNTGNSGVATNTGNGGTTTTSLAPGSAGSAFSVNDGAGDNVDVEMVKILDPAIPATAFDNPPDGDQLVAVQMWVQNQANTTFTDDMNSDVTLIGSDSQSYTAVFENVSACTNFNSGTVALSKGASSVGCVAFNLPSGVSIGQVEFKPGADFNGAPVVWNG